MARVHTQLNLSKSETKAPVNKVLFILKINVTIKQERNKILAYSAIKIKANNPPAYSVLNPETNSLSPSVKSKGVRLLSAKQQNHQKKNKGIKDTNILKEIITCINLSPSLV